MKTSYYSFLFIFLFAFSMSACAKQEKQNSSNTIEDSPQAFKMLEIPDLIQDENKRAEYFALHFWENFDFSDTAYIHVPEITERAFLQYITVFDHVGMQIVQKSIDQVLTQSSTAEKSGKMYAYFLNLFHKYFQDPSSPIREDEYYIPVTEYILQDTISDMASKERAKFELTMMMKNRKGEKASNFKYVRIDDSADKMYDIKAEYLMLYFYNADCGACREITAYIDNSTVFSEYIQSGKLKVLAVYPDEDFAAWRKQLKDMPSSWIVAYDKDQVLNPQQVYDLKAIPSIYLLDKDKKVLMKDAEVLMVEHYLNQQN